MFADYERTEGVEDTVILTCSECGFEFSQLRWQFEVDVEEEGDAYASVCPICQGLEDFL